MINALLYRPVVIEIIRWTRRKITEVFSKASAPPIGPSLSSRILILKYILLTFNLNEMLHTFTSSDQGKYSWLLKYRLCPWTPHDAQVETESVLKLIIHQPYLCWNDSECPAGGDVCSSTIQGLFHKRSFSWCRRVKVHFIFFIWTLWKCGPLPNVP